MTPPFHRPQRLPSRPAAWEFRSIYPPSSQHLSEKRFSPVAAGAEGPCSSSCFRRVGDLSSGLSNPNLERARLARILELLVGRFPPAGLVICLLILFRMVFTVNPALIHVQFASTLLTIPKPIRILLYSQMSKCHYPSRIESSFFLQMTLPEPNRIFFAHYAKK
jgi:hypothetical protein